MGMSGPHTDRFYRDEVEPLLRRIVHLERAMAAAGLRAPPPSTRHEADIIKKIAAYASGFLYEDLPEGEGPMTEWQPDRRQTDGQKTDGGEKD